MLLDARKIPNGPRKRGLRGADDQGVGGGPDAAGNGGNRQGDHKYRGAEDRGQEASRTNECHVGNCRNIIVIASAADGEIAHAHGEDTQEDQSFCFHKLWRLSTAFKDCAS